jgi:hypothetical protein
MPHFNLNFYSNLEQWSMHAPGPRKFFISGLVVKDYRGLTILRARALRGTRHARIFGKAFSSINFLVQIECGETGRENITYYLSSSTTTSITTSSPAFLSRPTVCEYRVCPAGDNICRLRLDFNTFKIAAPNTAVRAPPTAGPPSGPSVVLDAAPKIGVCERDSFTGWENLSFIKACVTKE